MTTEKDFAESHHAFWHDLLPLGEIYIRRLNRSRGRFLAPMLNVSGASERGVVNELGFRLFVRAARLGVESAWSTEDVDGEVHATVDYLARMRQFSRHPPTVPSEDGIAEARLLAQRLFSFFQRIGRPTPVCSPGFRGCGWIAACDGDLLADGVLFEIKAGDRSFRGIDLRQLLCYAALNFSSKQYDIHSICLINPRHGTFFQSTINDVCYGAAGKIGLDVLSAIADYISEPSGRYRTG